MKCSRRYLCVLLCFVLSLGVFSVSVSAAELELPSYTITEESFYFTPNEIASLGTCSFTSGDGNLDNNELTITMYGSAFATINIQMVRTIDINSGNAVLAESGEKTTIELDNVYYAHLIEPYNASTFSPYYDFTLTYASLVVRYASGSTERIVPQAKYTANSFYYNLSATFTPKDDIVSLRWELRSSLKDDTGYNSSSVANTTYVKVTSYVGERTQNDYKLTISQPNEEETLLGGIWDGITSGFSALGEKLTNVWNSIINGFAEVGNKLTDVWNSIIELPSKIWGFIEDGLKGLFVPSEEAIVSMKSQWEELLADKYGAVWEVVQVTFLAWENINANDLKNSIELPEVSIPLPDNETFSFGGEEVKVVPDGFEPIANICKIATGAFCTLMFINGLRKRYDEVMGVEQ